MEAINRLLIRRGLTPQYLIFCVPRQISCSNLQIISLLPNIFQKIIQL